jgi:lipopolysaccharide transport system ATP-binding protein
MNLSSVVTNLQTKDDGGEVLVRVENVSKRFCRSLKKSLWYGLQDIGSEIIGRKYEHELRPDEFWAVKDVSFELRRGECLGLIGRNGAGKSTLLRILNGLIKPDKGRIEINGQVGGLIALGAGFNPILTGRENIYVNGSILGLSKAEIDAKFEEIIEFAEIGEFIDAPVQTYSSGMNVRLGFAVAAVLIQPDVLLLDEVLAVGDMGFTIKCLNKVREITSKSSVIFVSHNMQFISTFCSEVMVMQKGQTNLHTKKVYQGVENYLSLFSIESNIAGTQEAEIKDCYLLSSDLDDQGFESKISAIDQGSQAILSLTITNNSSVKGKLSIYIMDNTQNPVVCYCAPEELNDHAFNNIKPGFTQLRVDLGSIELNAGRYSFTIVLVNTASFKAIMVRHQGLYPFQVRAKHVHWGQFIRFPDVYLVKNSQP